MLLISTVRLLQSEIIFSFTFDEHCKMKKI